MIRKTLLVLMVLLVGVVLYFVYKNLEFGRDSMVGVYATVPKDATLVIEVVRPIEQWRDIFSNNIIWDELHILEPVERFGILVDSLLSVSELGSVTPFAEVDEMIFCVVSDSNGQYVGSSIHLTHMLGVRTKEVKDYLATRLNWGKSKLLLDDVYWFEKSGWYVYCVNERVVITRSKAVIHSIVSQVSKGVSILDSSNFDIVKNTSSKNTKVRFFIESRRFVRWMSRSVNTSVRSIVEQMTGLGSWVELDVDVLPDEVSMNGFIAVNDSLDWLGVFKNQEAVLPRVVKVLPNRVALMFHVGFSSFTDLRDNLLHYRLRKTGVDYNKSIDILDTMYDVSIGVDIIPWIDSEIALVLAEPNMGSINEEVMLWVGSTNSGNMMERLIDLSLKVANKKQEDLYRVSYLGYEIYRLDISNFVSFVTGFGLDMIEKPYFTQIEEYIVFANTPSVLQWTINRLKSEDILADDLQYQLFEKRVSGESNIFIYNNIARSPDLYKLVVDKALEVEIEQHRKWLQKFQVGSIQLSYENDDLYYINSYWRYNPVYKEESNSLWELALDAPVKMKPAMVKNHYTNATEIFVQDTSNMIYLVSNKGKILWKRKLKEKIKSGITQVDLYRNGKLQMVFNTDNYLYIVDRNGKDIPNYPVKLLSEASSTVSVMDYEQTKDYRFLIPTKDGRILNFNGNGKLVKGWRYEETMGVIVQPLEHIHIKGKDYLVAIYSDGNVRALNRKGKVRISFSSRFNFNPLGRIYVHSGSELESTYLLTVTQKGEVVKITLSDNKIRLFSVGIDSISGVTYADIDSDGSVEIIVHNSDSILAYKTDGKEVLQFKTTGNISYLPNVYMFSSGAYIGYVSDLQNKIYLCSSKGRIVEGFPKNGASPFTVKDINKDGRFEIITINKGGVLFAYTMSIN